MVVRNEAGEAVRVEAIDSWDEESIDDHLDEFADPRLDAQHADGTGGILLEPGATSEMYTLRIGTPTSVGDLTGIEGMRTSGHFG